MTTFWLGTHLPNWLGLTDMPLFVSHHRLRERKTFPRALGPWALDSGAFSEIKEHGHFRTLPGEYAKAVKRYQDEIGQLAWCAPQDWMCEPVMLAKTGYTIADHQWLSVQSFLELREYGIPVIPVVQGGGIADYLRCADLYAKNGVDLAAQPLVGVGSVCRRQHSKEIEGIFAALAYRGLRLHGFGVKKLGLDRYADLLVSADSMAWSYAARNLGPQEGCSHGKDGTGNCANCIRWAMQWRTEVVDLIASCGRVSFIPGAA